MSDGKIYITISDTRYGSGGGVSSDTPGATENDDKESVLSKYARHRFFNMIESNAKQFVNYSVNNIGNFTGNYQAQRDAQATLSAANFLINLGTSMYAGAKMTKSWVGAVVAGAITIAQTGINFGYQMYSDILENKRTNRNIDIMRTRLGLEGLTDGSRTGGY